MCTYMHVSSDVSIACVGVDAYMLAQISGCVITIEVLEDEYVAQVSCPQMYDSIR